MKKKLLCTLFTFVLAFCGIFGTMASANAEKQYARGGEPLITFTETVSYNSRQNPFYNVNPEFPKYVSSLSCGPTAGGNTVAWYTYQYPELIPGREPGRIFLGKWQWKGQDEYIDNLYADLNTRMGGSSEGVTIAGYLSGLSSYVASKGRTFSQPSSSRLMNSNGTLDYEACKTALEAGKILSIFTDTFALVDIFVNNGSQTTFTTYKYSGAHIMSVFGWYEEKYINSSGVMFRHDKYLRVHVGLSPEFGYLRLDSHTGIDDCYITHVS